MPALLKDHELQPSARAAVSMSSTDHDGGGGGGGGGGGFFERCCPSGVSCPSVGSVRPASPGDQIVLAKGAEADATAAAAQQAATTIFSSIPEATARIAQNTRTKEMPPKPQKGRKEVLIPVGVCLTVPRRPTTV